MKRAWRAPAVTTHRPLPAVLIALMLCAVQPATAVAQARCGTSLCIGSRATPVRVGGDLSVEGTTLVRSLGTTTVDAGTVIAAIYEGPSASVWFARSHALNGGVAFDLFTDITMTSGTLLSVSNLFTPVFTLDYKGEGNFSSSVEAGDTFIMTGGGSGQPAITVAKGLYLPVLGQLPYGYWGHHGVLTAVNANATIAGYLQEWNSNRAGTTADKVAAMSFEGGYFQPQQINESSFAPCTNTDPFTYDPGDGGSILATDAGNAWDGEMMYAADKHRWCFCNSRANDGGGAGSTGDGWIRFKDEAACSQ